MVSKNPTTTVNFPKGKVDLTGRSFNRWTVISFAYAVQRRSKGYHYYWNCRCKCGTQKEVEESSLIYSDKGRGTKSCGCHRIEVSGQLRRTHGRTRTVEYSIYRNILNRCYDTKNAKYHRYGGRGIRMCLYYREDFSNFLADVGIRPSTSHSIDRIDNDGNYSCGHCAECLQNDWTANLRWTTKDIQARNSTTATMITWNEKTQCIKDWAHELGISYTTLQQRFHPGYGTKAWSVEKALTTPVRQRKHKLPCTPNESPDPD